MDRCHLSNGVTLTALTRGPKHHLYGYFDKCPWDASGRFVLGHEVSFIDRPPTADDVATLGLIDLEKGGEFRAFDQTKAWNWQQGSMLQWRPRHATEVIYNVRDENSFRAVARDIVSGATRKLPLTIHALSPDGNWGVTVNYSRLAVERPGYGYQGIPDPFAKDLAPKDDGLWLMNLNSGEHRLLISLAQLAEFKPLRSMVGAKHRVYTSWFNDECKRIIFIHRWQQPKRGHMTRLYTIGIDGSALHLVNDNDFTSHYCWLDNQRILAWARQKDRGDHYFIFHDQTDRADVMGPEVLTHDGHCTLSPDSKWILTDTYPQNHMRALILYELASGKRIDVGSFYSPPEIDGEIRCDLHPRFNRNGTQICIDSLHEGHRQIYAVDVSCIVRG
jgi:hypothetical protein